MESRPTEGSIENSESNQDDANLSDDPQSYPQRKRKIKKPNLDEQIIKALQSNEDDTNYCLSLVPFMKELTSDEKLEVRIRILQTFQDINKKRLLLTNTSFNIIQPSTSQFPRASRHITPSTSIRIISDKVIKPNRSRSVHSTRQANLSQHLTESHQHSNTKPQDTIPSYMQLSSPSPESQTPPPPHDHDGIISYWSNFSESESELIDL
ncbi:unnamed protein product [Parnassius apollo]|uniref:(apollo) hypothetical protein n=1 Tax=Parnassius apollo TaxID=110799 RepID=A0A8S3WJA0_PARAO|nr:unnamed protein product [Parnassius apollo]